MFYDRKWVFVLTLLSYGTAPGNVQIAMPYPPAQAIGGCPYAFCPPPLPPPPPQMIAVPQPVPVPVPHPVPIGIPFAIIQRPKKTTTTTTTTPKSAGDGDEQEFVGIAFSLPFVVPGVPAMGPPPGCIKKPCVPAPGQPPPPPPPGIPFPMPMMPPMMPPMIGPPPPPSVFMVPFPPIRIEKGKKKKKKEESECDDSDSDDDNTRRRMRRKYRRNMNFRRNARLGRFRNYDKSYVKPMLSYVARNGDVKFETKISNREADKLLRQGDSSDDKRTIKDEKDVQILTRTNGQKRQQIVILTNNKNRDSQETRRFHRRNEDGNKMLESGKKELVFTAPKHKQITNLSLSFRVSK